MGNGTKKRACSQINMGELETCAASVWYSYKTRQHQRINGDQRAGCWEAKPLAIIVLGADTLPTLIALYIKWSGVHAMLVHGANKRKETNALKDVIRIVQSSSFTFK